MSEMTIDEALYAVNVEMARGVEPYFDALIAHAERTVAARRCAMIDAMTRGDVLDEYMNRPDSYSAMADRIVELTARLAEVEARTRSMADDILRVIPADWKPGLGREWDAHLTNILAEYVGDLRTDHTTLAGIVERVKALPRLDVADSDGNYEQAEMPHLRGRYMRASEVLDALTPTREGA
jgi:DNA-binding transcriptional regulator YdaS (Cro superfamily)